MLLSVEVLSRGILPVREFPEPYLSVGGGAGDIRDGPGMLGHAGNSISKHCFSLVI